MSALNQVLGAISPKELDELISQGFTAEQIAVLIPMLEKKAEKSPRNQMTLEDFAEELKSQGITLRHNVVTNSIDIQGYSESESPEHILQTLPTILYSDLRTRYKGVTQQVITDYMLTIATRNCFNPVLDLFNKNKWDETDRLEDVYTALCIDKSDSLSRILILKWFWQGHALLRNDPTQPIGADGILTLAGQQGIGKTSFFRKVSISPKFFREGQSIDNYDKDSKRRCLTTWIAELGEVDTTLKSDMGALKAFITNAYDEYRLPYGRADQKSPRRTNLGATVNGTQFLIDPTGNRRFWTIPLENIDLEKLAELDALQIWLQVWEQYAKDDINGFRLTKREQEKLTERNAGCEKPIKAEDEILDIIDDADCNPNKYDWVYMTVSDFKDEHPTLRAYSVQQIGAVFNKLGIEARRSSVNGKKVRSRTLPKLKRNELKRNEYY